MFSPTEWWINDMPKRKEPELDPKEQFKRFQETAKEHGLSEGAVEFSRIFQKLAPNPNDPKRRAQR